MRTVSLVNRTTSPRLMAKALTKLSNGEVKHKPSTLPWDAQSAGPNMVTEEGRVGNSLVFPTRYPEYVSGLCFSLRYRIHWCKEKGFLQKLFCGLRLVVIDPPREKSSTSSSHRLVKSLQLLSHILTTKSRHSVLRSLHYLRVYRGYLCTSGCNLAGFGLLTSVLFPEGQHPT